MRSTRLVIAVAVVLAGCGGSSGAADGDPCALTSPAMVQEAFGGSSSEGEAGEARNCGFEIDGGSATSINVFHYGSADSWDSVRAGFDENRGGTTDVPGLGDMAFYPNGVGPSELIVAAGDVIFSVSTGAFGGSGPASEAGLMALAQAIAAAQADY